VEKHADGYVVHPLGLSGVVVGEGDSYEEALADVRSARSRSASAALVGTRTG
jgi:hypothetical protein